MFSHFIRTLGNTADRPFLRWLAAWCVAAVVAIGPPPVHAQEEEARSDEQTITITQDEIDAMIQAREAEPTEGEEMQADETTRRTPPAGPNFEADYLFPGWRYIYGDWLTTGRLDFLVPLENQLTQRQSELRRMTAGRRWTEGLQRELDLLQDEITGLETERADALRARIAEVETDVGRSPATQTGAALFNMALALVYLDEGKAKLALEALERADAALPNEPLVHTLAGVALRETGDNAGARAELRDALAAQPKLLTALVTLAQVEEDELNYEGAAELWDRARLARAQLPEGEDRLPANFSDQFTLRLRLARLREFAQKHYQAEDRPGFRLVFDPSLAVPENADNLLGLREAAGIYLQGGERDIDPVALDRVFRDLRTQRDPDAFRQSITQVTNFLDSAGSELTRVLPHRRATRPIVVLYNPAVWETLVADRKTLGVYAPHGQVVGLYVSPRVRPELLGSTVYHEYAHFLTFELTGPRDLPLWLVEGIAEYLALESGYDRFDTDKVLQRWEAIWSKDPVERPWFNKKAEDFGDADYFKARRAVSILAQSFGPNALTQFLTTLGDGADLNEASLRAFRMEYPVLLQFVIRRLPTWQERR